MPLRQTITSPDATFNGQSTEEHQDPHRPQLDELCIDIWMTESLTTSCGLSPDVQRGAAPVHALRDGCEVMLNAPAQQRLAVFAGIPLQRLARCLPLPAFTFLDGADDHGTPRLAMVGAVSQTRRHCALCIARLPGTPPIKVYHRHAPVICRRHHRWLGIPTAPGQFDLSDTPEIITAHRRRDRLLRSLHDQR